MYAGLFGLDLEPAQLSFPWAKNETADLGGPYPGIQEGGTRLPVWDAVGCKPEGLPEVAAVEVVGSEAYLTPERVLPCSHIDQCATFTKSSELISAAVTSVMMGVEGR